ncbi:saccharopine dehydrogenase NADP-binding domain-containing protein [Enterococcus sp. DIV0187]|uniref:saccharopine dehydrogenase NADP-binding domain-containing protein n=1 Tax=Enterococcus sp. DIV0187 TaxID=2774644 RepID=UPI003F1FAC67
MMSEKRVLIVGGYGDVGKHVVDELLSKQSSTLIIGGRSEEKARQVIDQYGSSNVEYLHLDIYGKKTYENRLANVRMVVMCLNPNNTEFAHYCLSEGIHYLDTSPSNHVVNELEKFDGYFKQKGAACILGVGICPGLSTLAASELMRKFDTIEDSSLSLLLGLGESYGNDAIHWLFANLKQPFCWNTKEGSIDIVPFVEGTTAHFPKEIGKRSVYAFNLSDQQILTRTMEGNPTVSTYFCYDSRFLTGVMHLMSSIRLTSLLKFSKLENLMTHMVSFGMKQKKLGSDSFSIHVSCLGQINNEQIEKSISIIGENSNLITGKVIAQTVMKVSNKSIESGVHYLNQLFQLADYDIEDFEVID